MTDQEKELQKEANALRLRVQAAEGLLLRVRRVAMSESFHLTREPNAREQGISLMDSIDEFLGETPSGATRPQEVARG